jgi:hypothetical protein
MPDTQMVSALYMDVFNLVNARGSLLHERSSDSTFRKVGRYIMRNKAKIASGVVKTVAAGLLTGGIGAVVIVGGTAAIYVAKRLYRRKQSSDATANIAHAKQTVGGMTKTVSSASSDRTIQIVNYQYSFVLSDLATLCSNNAMTDIMTAFIELDEDGKALQEIMPLPMKKTLTSCDEAWSLLEHVERIKLREADLADAMDLFQELIEYIVLVTASYEDDPTELNHFEWRRRRAVEFIINKCPGQTIDQKKVAALQLLNTEANSSDVFHTRFFSKDKDLTEWIIQHNPEFEATRRGDMPIISNGQASTVGVATQQALIRTAFNSATQGVATAGRVLNNLNNQADLLSGVTTVSRGLAESALSSIAASATSSGIGIVSDVIFLSLANYIDKELLEKYRTALNNKISEDEKARKSGLAQKPLIELFAEVDSEAVAALRTSAKKIITKTAEKLEHLVTADQELNGINSGSTSAGELAKKLMRRQKLQDQVDVLKPLLFLFHEYTTVRAIGIINSSKALEKHIKESIVSWVDNHPISPCSHDKTVCYMDSALGFSHEIAGKVNVILPQGMTEDNFRKLIAGRPVHPGPKGEGGLRKEIDKYS